MGNGSTHLNLLLTLLVYTILCGEWSKITDRSSVVGQPFAVSLAVPIQVFGENKTNHSRYLFAVTALSPVKPPPF